MAVIKISDWVKSRWAALKAAGSKIQPVSLTDKMRTIASNLRNTGTPMSEWVTNVRRRSSGLASRLGERIRTSGWQERGSLLWLKLKEQYAVYRKHLYAGLGAIGIAAMGTLGVQQYVAAHTIEVFHVYVGGQQVGTVSSPQVVDDFKLAKYKELEEKNPNVHMILNTEDVILKSEKAFNAKSDDQAALKKLDERLQPHAVGVELVVDGKVIGVVKDKDTAEQILNQIKGKYVGSAEQEKGKVGILSVRKDLNPGESEVQKAEFIQKVELNQKPIEPEQLMDPNEMLRKLETGDVQPTKYTVEKGDCVSCIAKKFGISKQVIYENNPWIADDMIKVGQKLDLTVLQPTLSVKTVEKVVERQEIQYDTDYITDDSLRLGVIQTITPGKNGLKNVTFLVTKVNGKMMDEELLNEEIIQQPVKAVAKKGTKVVLGEGSGKFAWPVLGSSVTSGYGYRWGVLHKGIDLVSNNKSIMAADNGKVVYAGYKADYGNHIIIDHLNGYRTLYGHLSKIDVSVGKIVEKGEKIGVMGSTGDSTGVHLHFEIQKNGSVDNPLKYLNR